MGPSEKPPLAGHDGGMQSSLLADDDLPDAASLVAAVAQRATPGHFDEWCASVSGTSSAAGHLPAPHWRQFFNTLGTEGWADLGGPCAAGAVPRARGRCHLQHLCRGRGCAAGLAAGAAALHRAGRRVDPDRGRRHPARPADGRHPGRHLRPADTAARRAAAGQPDLCPPALPAPGLRPVAGRALRPAHRRLRPGTHARGRLPRVVAAAAGAVGPGLPAGEPADHRPAVPRPVRRPAGAAPGRHLPQPARRPGARQPGRRAQPHRAADARAAE